MGVKDYWQTPVELQATGQGDCEDYAIYKYFAPKERGFPFGLSYLCHAKHVPTGQAHMVPLVDPQVLVLDNLLPTIVPLDNRRDLAPVHAFNHDGLYLVKQTPSAA